MKRVFQRSVVQFLCVAFLLSASTALGAKPTPTPAPTPKPSPSASASPSATANPSPSASASATASPSATVTSGGGKKSPTPAPSPTPIIPPAPLVDPDGTWTANASSAWSSTSNWAGGIVADGGGFADFSTVNITGARTVTIDTLSRFVRRIDIGDTNNTHNWTIAASGGASLVFDNTANAANAQLNSTVGSLNNTISAPVALNSSLDITNASAGNLTLSNTVGSNSAGTKTITTSTGTVTISGAITNGPSGSVALTQSGPGTLALTNAANTYSGDTTITGGKLSLDGDSEPGTGTLFLSGGTLVISASTRDAATDPVVNNVVVTANSTIDDSSIAATVNVNFTGTLTGTAGTLTITNTGADAATDTFAVRFSGGDYTMSRPIVLDNGNGRVSLNDFNTVGTTHTYSGVISGTGSYVRSITTGGTGGTTTFTANNTYTGTTTVSNGTLEISNTNSSSSGRVSGTSNITLNSGGTLLLSGSSSWIDRINDSATITMAGGRFNTGGLSEYTAGSVLPGMGALTLTGNSIIDMGSGASIIAFANSSGSTWTALTTLSIYNWSGTPLTGGGTDQVYFGTDITGLTAAQLLEITFYSDSGTTSLGTAIILANGEIVPIPEPSTWIGAALVLLALGYTQRRRFAKRTL